MKRGTVGLRKANEWKANMVILSTWAVRTRGFYTYFKHFIAIFQLKKQYFLIEINLFSLVFIKNNNKLNIIKINKSMNILKLFKLSY